MPKTLVEQKFGAHAAAYAVSEVHAKGQSLERLLTLIEPRPDWRALDIATGAGHTAAALAPFIAHVTACDLTLEMLQQTRALVRKRGLANVETVRCDASALSFASASFDLVTCRLAAHHFPDPQAFVRDVSRVLKPGGTFALVDNIAPDAELLRAATEREILDTSTAYNAFEKLRDPSHGQCLTVAEWRTLIEAAGLSAVHIERLTKPMEFYDWAKRLGASRETIAALERTLDGADSRLRAFLQPQRSGANLTITLHEVVMIAHRPS